uniref:tRNA (adenine(58)-N(1))-methyltransferase TrmI n=1 Tax=candidate division WOR-3 bacterium TaxID=2052148 RepID=A0A7C6AFW7_UNCW3
MEENSINQGDLVLIYLDDKRQFLIQVVPKLKLSTDLGDIRVDEIISKEFGFVGKTHLGRNFYCLKPTISDLMLKIKRKTTIVYPKDLGYLLFETAIGPGSKVIEVGTGSGALTLFLSRIVAPDGVVYSYERNEEFLENAKKNLEKVKYKSRIEYFLRDVAIEGFIQKNIDAIFIDVPEPWDIVPRAFDALKGGHHLVAWSPNVEQVKKTVEVLQASNFIRIKVCEVVQRDILVRERGVRPRERGITHTAYLVSATKARV